MKLNRIALSVVSLCIVCVEFISIAITYAIEEAPCCPPSLAKLTRTFAAQLKQITKSSIYQTVRIVILIILAIMILYVVILIILAFKREAKASKEKALL